MRIPTIFDIEAIYYTYIAGRNEQKKATHENSKVCVGLNIFSVFVLSGCIRGYFRHTHTLSIYAEWCFCLTIFGLAVVRVYPFIIDCFQVRPNSFYPAAVCLSDLTGHNIAAVHMRVWARVCLYACGIVERA